MMTNALGGTQPELEGEPVANAGIEIAPEQTNEHNTDHNEGNAGEEIEGGAEGQDGEVSGEAGGEGEQKPKPGEKKKLPWELRRIHEETNKRREAEKRATDLEAELTRLRKGGTEEPAPVAAGDDIDTRVERQAEQIVQQREFQKRVNGWAAAGQKEFGLEEFNEQCNLIASLVDGRTQNELMDTLTDPDQVPDGHKVIMELAADPEEAERILALPPKRMALALNKIAEKLAKPATPTPKPISKVPAPVTPIGGRAAAATNLDDPDIPMDKFADKFLKDMATKGR